MDLTDEFSFALKPSAYGVGVFALVPIKKGSYLRLFGDKNSEGELQDRARILPTAQVPATLQGFCINRGDMLICPPDFGEMAIGWYLNHSATPNAYRDAQYRWFALRDITEGEEITIDYNSLEEPESGKEDFYHAT